MNNLPPLTHHPECWWWHENENEDCDCGLLRDARQGLRPWSQAALDEWRKARNVTLKARKETTV